MTLPHYGTNIVCLSDILAVCVSVGDCTGTDVENTALCWDDLSESIKISTLHTTANTSWTVREDFWWIPQRYYIHEDLEKGKFLVNVTMTNMWGNSLKTEMFQSRNSMHTLQENFSNANANTFIFSKCKYFSKVFQILFKYFDRSK